VILPAKWREIGRTSTFRRLVSNAAGKREVGRGGGRFLEAEHKLGSGCQIEGGSWKISGRG